MAKISTTNIVDNRLKNVTTITTTIGRYICDKVNATPHLRPLDKFIQAMRAEKNDLIVYRDSEDEFMAFTRFGAVYNYYNGRYTYTQYVAPSAIPTEKIEYLIEDELRFRDYDNVADMYHFLSLSAEEKDKVGFSFYSWLWEESLVDYTMTDCFGEDEEPKMPLSDLQALALLKKAMEES